MKVHSSDALSKASRFSIVSLFRSTIQIGQFWQNFYRSSPFYLCVRVI